MPGQKSRELTTPPESPNTHTHTHTHIHQHTHTPIHTHTHTHQYTHTHCLPTGPFHGISDKLRATEAEKRETLAWCTMHNIHRQMHHIDTVLVNRAPSLLRTKPTALVLPYKHCVSHIYCVINITIIKPMRLY